MKLRFMFLFAAGLALLGVLWSSAPAAAAPEVTFVVNTTKTANFDGVCNAAECTLNEAITTANATAAKDKIKFNIPAATDPGCNAGTGICTLTPRSQLPVITQPVTIDGYSQPGATVNTKGVGMNTNIKIALEGQGDQSFIGLFVTGGDTLIRGLSLTGFVIAILLDSDNNRIMGNFIGMKPDGVTPVANGAGFRISAFVATTQNNIGSALASERNLISGNGQAMYASQTFRLTLQGNYIGTDKSGLVSSNQLGNTVFLNNPQDLLIGGIEPGQGNVIGSNGSDIGIQLWNPKTGRIINNNIGVAADNKTAIGNDIGIDINNTLFETDHTEIVLNRIAHSSHQGIRVTEEAKNISFSRNSIFANGGLGIDLGDGGVSPNDAKDVDQGPNNLQNFPVLDKVNPSGGGTTIKGKLNSTPSKGFRIEFFTNPTCDASGHGEGKRYLGVQSVITNSNGNANFTFHTNKILLAGTQVTATATDSAGNGTPLSTSEFSKCKAAS